MASTMDGFAAYERYELIRVDTGIPLYSTCATRDEIIQANVNLKNKNIPSRFYPVGTFHMPSLHSPPSAVRPAI